MRGFTLASVIVLVIVVAVVAIAAILLARTVQTAQAINAKAQRIAKNGRGINKSTDSVIQLTRTNDLATSILRTATPLQGQLAGIVNTANRINGLAGSINATALRINSTASSINSSAININSAATSINASAGSILNSAGTINNSAGSINNSAGSINNSARNINTSARSIRGNANTILGTARAIDTDVTLINQNLDVSLSLVTAVKSDTGNILAQAVGAHDTAACIDRKLFGSTGNDGDCQGRLNATSTRSSTRGATPTGANAAGTPTSAPTPTPSASPAPSAGQAPLPTPDVGGLPQLPDLGNTVGQTVNQVNQTVDNLGKTVNSVVPGSSGG